MEFYPRPLPDPQRLRELFVGKDVTNVSRPCAILDQAKVKRHCSAMLDTASSLGVTFRPHVKSHKTIEGARLQIGTGKSDVNIVFSTLAELEHLIPLLKEYQAEGRNCNALYGLPIPLSQSARLAQLGRELGRDSLSVLVDNASQLQSLGDIAKLLGFPLGVFLKVDTGYHRAGLPPAYVNKGGLLEQILELQSRGGVEFIGFYAHSSLSYNNSTPEEAFDSLREEIEGCLDALKNGKALISKDKPLTLSVGASPQVTCTQHLTSGEGSQSSSAKKLLQTIDLVKNDNPWGFTTKLELHAGVYSLLDIQQVSTNAKARLIEYENEIAITVMTEVCSLYHDGERKQPEALLAVGALGLGREPCAFYRGWGVVKQPSSVAGVNPERRLIVSRVSQEHAIVSWEHNEDKECGKNLPSIPLEIGQAVEIYPNHACIAGAMHGWYLVVDSKDASRGSKIVDVWVRAAGW